MGQMKARMKAGCLVNSTAEKRVDYLENLMAETKAGCLEYWTVEKKAGCLACLMA
jgi:hypothetical protein